MKAMVYGRYGGADVLEWTDVPRPSPGPGQILVRVRATSVNPIDWKIASGKLRPILAAVFPQVTGYDLAGEVAGVGSGVTDLEVGQRVHARLVGKASGAAAEYAVVDVAVTATVPEGMDTATAAGLPLAGMTALQGLRDHGGVSLSGGGRPQRVLVIGAAGGVGHLAVQIARAAGATVVGVCSTRNQALVSSLGADVVDYLAPAPFRDLAPCDIILDCVGGAPGDWLPLLSPGGRYVSTRPGPAMFLRGALNFVTDKQVSAVMLKSNAADLRTLDDLVVAGKLRVVVGQRFALPALGEAWKHSMSGHAVGKIVVDVDG